MRPKGKYDSHMLCISSLVYLFLGVIVFKDNLYLGLLFFVVTLFALLHHGNFKNFSFKALDWIFGIILAVYIYYLTAVKFDTYIFSFLIILAMFRLLDHILFRMKRYGIFSYTHSMWHVLSGVLTFMIISL